MGSARRVSAGLLVVGGLLYSLWLLEFVLRTDVSPLSSYVSELGAHGEPNSWLFRLGDTLAGTCLAAASLVALLLLRRDEDRRTERWTFRLLALFGLSTLGDSLAPMDCVATRDASCAAREAAWQVSWTHLAHTVTSTVAATAVGVAFLVLLWRRPRGRCWLGRSTRLAMTGLYALWLFFLAATLVAHLPGPETGLLGLFQRVQLLLTTVLLAVLGWRWWGSQPQQAPVVAHQRVGQQPRE